MFPLYFHKHTVLLIIIIHVEPASDQQMASMSSTVGTTTGELK